MKKICITGGISTGKTTFLKILSSLGFDTFSCDKVVKNFYQDEKIKKELLRIFGEEILDERGEIKKVEVLKKIIKDQDLRKKLEELFHPLVREELINFFKSTKAKGKKLVFAEVPLVFEAGWKEFFDEIWVLTCSKKTQQNRIKTKGKFSELFLKLADTQIPLEKKEKLADRVFSSEKPPEELKKEIKVVLKEYLKD